MNLVHEIVRWEQPRRNTIVLIARIVLGMIIALKGILFLSDINRLFNLIEASRLDWFAMSGWVWYIAVSSLFCGVLIILGLFTRFALILQLPILVGAVFFINPSVNGVRFNAEFFLSLLALILLIRFLIRGPGEISMDVYRRRYQL